MGSFAGDQRTGSKPYDAWLLQSVARLVNPYCALERPAKAGSWCITAQLDLTWGESHWAILAPHLVGTLKYLSQTESAYGR